MWWKTISPVLNKSEGINWEYKPEEKVIRKKESGKTDRTKTIYSLQEVEIALTILCLQVPNIRFTTSYEFFRIRFLKQW